jgi:hypothetical protein
MDASDWSHFVSQEEAVIVTRFSFFGRSGWKSPFSRDPAALFDDERLRLRLDLFESLPLASLAAQTDQNFHHYILTSTLLPRWALRELRAKCAEVLPDDKFSIVPRQPGIAATHLRRFLAARSKTGKSLHVILDDDDALSNDFVARLRERMSSLSAPTEEEYRCVSFAKGYAFDLTDFSKSQLRVYSHRYPFINLGLAMVGASDKQNLLSVAHRKFPLKYEHALVNQAPHMFVRAIHSANDSRVEVGERWQELDNWRDNADMAQRFPYMLRA